MSNAFSDDPDSQTAGTPGVQPLQGDDTSIEPDAAADPAQREWDRTEAADAAIAAGVDLATLDTATATSDDPAHIPADDDEIPADDLPGAASLPETQGGDPVVAELGDDGEGDLSPEDL